MAVEIACVLLLSTMLWDLSSGGKGCLQSHREPLSILGLATVVVYFYISVYFYTLFFCFCLHLFEFKRIESYSGKWYNVKSITFIATSITSFITFTKSFNTTFIATFITSSATSRCKSFTTTFIATFT
eukprot:404831_1